MRKKLTAFDVALVILLTLLSLIFIYPLWTIFVATFSDPMDYVKNPLALWPENFTLYNFKNLLTTQSIWRGYRNTIVYTVLGVIIEVTMTFVMAYAFQRGQYVLRPYQSPREGLCVEKGQEELL